MAHFWPLVERLLLSRHMEDNELALAASQTLSHAIQATAATAVEEFGHELEHGPLFIETLQAFTVSDEMSAMTSSYTCDQEPDLAEAYMNFTSIFVRCCRKVRALRQEYLKQGEVEILIRVLVH